MKLQSIILSCFIALSSLALANSTNLSESGITIQPHTRSAALNAKHAAECAEQGGTDVTDNLTFVADINTADFSACHITNFQKYQEFLDEHKIKYYKILNGKKSELNLLKELSSNGKLVDAYAPNGYYDSYPFTAHGLSIYNGNGSTTLFADGGTKINGDFFYSGNDCYIYTTSRTIIESSTRNYVISWNIAGCYYSRISQAERLSSSYANLFTQLHGGDLVDGANSIGTIYHPTSTKDDVDMLKNLGMPEDVWGCNIPSSFIGNPINISVGNKFQQELDISKNSNGISNLDFIRMYNSFDGIWHHNYSTRLENLDKAIIFLVNSDGRVSKFKNENDVIKPSPSELGTLTKISGGYQYTSPFHEIYEFDSLGRLIKTTSNGGLVYKIQYLSDTKLVVSDEFGHNLTVTETKDHQPLAVKSSGGITINYEYDAQNRLVKMTKDGKSRIYHYEDSRFPHALTGITDKNGLRYVTWTYDAAGRANSSYHAGDKDKVSIVYNSDTQTTFTNPLGREYVYSYGVFDGVKRVGYINGQASSLCPAIGSSYTYNNRGLVNIKSDGKGIKTSYNYNNSGQEVSRIIGFGTNNQIIIKTTWDDRFNLPKTETYPDKVITYDYDNKGNLVNRTVSAN